MVTSRMKQIELRGRRREHVVDVRARSQINVASACPLPRRLHPVMVASLGAVLVREVSSAALPAAEPPDLEIYRAESVTMG